MNDEQLKATDFVADWVAKHRTEIGGNELRVIRQEQYGRTYCAEFETVKYLIQFAAWDHASCLDILALDKESGSDAYIIAGDCDGVIGLSERLTTFLHWLRINETKESGEQFAAPNGP